MKLINKLKEKNNLPILLFIIFVINFIPTFINNAFTKEALFENNTVFEIICFLIEIVALIFFYKKNIKELKIDKCKLIILFIITIIMFLVQIKNFILKDFYIKDIMNIGIFFVNIFLFYILLYDFKIDEKDICFFLKGIMCFVVIAIIWNLVQFHNEILAEVGIINENIDYSYIDNPKGFFGNRNTLAFFIYLAIISDAILINIEGEKKSYNILFLLFLFGIWCTHSKTGYLMTVIFFELYILLNDSYKIKKKIILCLGVGILGTLGFLNILGYIPSNVGKVQELVIIEGRIKRLSGRRGIWKVCIDFLCSSPLNLIFGVGKFNSRKLLIVGDKVYSHCHNLYLELLVTGGLIELIYAGGIFFSVIRKILKSNLNKILKKIYLIMYFTYAVYIVFESFGKFSIGYNDFIVLIFFIAIPLLHANSENKQL